MFLNQAELAAHLAGRMAARGWGRVISIASTSVQEPIPGLIYSNAFRAGLQGWLKSLADELAGKGVTVNTVAPGAFATERTRSLDAAAAQRAGRPVAEVAAEGAAGIPAGRYGDPAEFGAFVAFVAAEQSGYATGAFFRVDGGASRGST
jgi:3-oxoacyl-[acyl-carrier protein] reductase